jgi:ABC-type glutathione transport system ATPase component
MSVLSAEDLTVAWDRGGGQDGATVLRDLTFSVERGRVLGLVGESGAGKSMIGRAIAGNLPDGFGVTGGALRFADQDLVSADAETRRTLLGNRIAFIPQEPLTALNPLMTIGPSSASISPVSACPDKNGGRVASTRSGPCGCGNRKFFSTGTPSSSPAACVNAC